MLAVKTEFFFNVVIKLQSTNSITISVFCSSRIVRGHDHNSVMDSDA